MTCPHTTISEDVYVTEVAPGEVQVVTVGIEGEGGAPGPNLISPATAVSGYAAGSLFAVSDDGLSLEEVTSFGLDAGEVGSIAAYGTFAAACESETLPVLAEDPTSLTAFADHGIGLTCIPTAVNGSGIARGIAITPKHWVSASHVYGTTVGHTLAFTDSNGTPVTRTTVGAVAIGPDLHLATLNAALPNTVTPAKLLPFAFCATYGATPTAQAGIFGMLQGGDFAVHPLTTLATSTAQWATGFLSNEAPLQSLWYKPVVGGDSGCPLFVILDGDVVAISTYFGAQAGANLAFLSPLIATAISGSGASLAYADVTGLVGQWT